MPIKFNVTKRRGKAKIKIDDKRRDVMNKIVDSYSEKGVRHKLVTGKGKRTKKWEG